jgi:hypothetical protein
MKMDLTETGYEVMKKTEPKQGHETVGFCTSHVQLLHSVLSQQKQTPWF